MNVPLFQAPPKRTAAMRDAESLFDFLADRPEGVTIQEISDHIGKETSGARKAVRTLRLLLGAGGDGDTINVVCEQPRPAELPLCHVSDDPRLHPIRHAVGLRARHRRAHV